MSNLRLIMYLDEWSTYKTCPLNPDTDLDGQNDKNDMIPLDYDMDGDERINEVALVTLGSSCYDKRLALCANNDPNLVKSGGNFVEDGDMDGDGLWDVGPVNYDDDCDGDGMPNWYESSYGVANNGWQNPFIYNARYALLIGGGVADSKSRLFSRLSD